MKKSRIQLSILCIALCAGIPHAIGAPSDSTQGSKPAPSGDSIHAAQTPASQKIVVAGMMVAGAGMIVLGVNTIAGNFCPTGENCAGIGLGILEVAGGIFMIASPIFAVGMSNRASASRGAYNGPHRASDRAREAALSNASLSPMLYPTRDGRLIPGLAARLTF